MQGELSSVMSVSFFWTWRNTKDFSGVLTGGTFGLVMILPEANIPKRQESGLFSKSVKSDLFTYKAGAIA
jgi:hypothetical protein